MTTEEGRQAAYAVDIRHWGNQSFGMVKAHLYRDGRQNAVSKLPAAFPVDGGTVEVSMSTFGLNRGHYVTTEGAEHQLVPDPQSAEGRRARFDRAHPVLSSGIGVVSLIVLVIGVIVLVSQVIAPLTLIPAVAAYLGTFTWPIHLPWWLDVAVVLVTGAASTERALRLRYNSLLDGAAG